MGYFLPLLPRHRIGLTVWWRGEAVPRSEARRFVVLFRQTWAKLPLAVRRRLLARWRAMGDGFPPPPPGARLFSERPQFPRIELCNGKSGFTAAVMGQCNAFGDLLAFWAAGAAVLPDRDLAETIAHELAHAFQAATGDPFARNRRARERGARGLAADWLGYRCPRYVSGEAGRKLAALVVKRGKLEHTGG